MSERTFVQQFLDLRSAQESRADDDSIFSFGFSMPAVQHKFLRPDDEQYVAWTEVEAFLVMAEQALRARNKATETMAKQLEQVRVVHTERSGPAGTAKGRAPAAPAGPTRQPAVGGSAAGWPRTPQRRPPPPPPPRLLQVERSQESASEESSFLAEQASGLLGERAALREAVQQLQREAHALRDENELLKQQLAAGEQRRRRRGSGVCTERERRVEGERKG
jgi:hypothetical protein